MHTQEQLAAILRTATSLHRLADQIKTMATALDGQFDQLAARAGVAVEDLWPLADAQG